MEYIEGGTLADLLLGGRPLPLTDAVGIVLQVCAALDYAHRHGVVHRDIKPRNILVGPGVTKVTDFGTARIVGASHTQTGTMLGTPAYMSPEMVRGLSTDPRSDLFSLGVVLYEALTGVNPFNAADLAAVLYRIVNIDAPSVRHHNAELPPALDRVVRRALVKESKARYATALDFANALREAGTGQPRKRPFRALREVAQDVRRSRLLSRPARVAFGALCLLALVGGTWAALRREPDLSRSVVTSPTVTIAEETARPATPTATATPRPATRSVAVAPPRPAAGTIAQAPRPSAPAMEAQTPRAAGPAARPPAPTAAAQAPPVKPPVATGAGPARPQESRCLSVNAIPFAQVYVDDQPVGYTPTACLRVGIGERRVVFEMDGQRSPERLLRISARHTPDAPMRLSYDFNTGRFFEQ
jgi:serine/threonine-protein kinase